MPKAFLMAARKLCRNNNKPPISISYSFPLADRHAGNAGSDLLFQEIHLFTTPTKNIITNHSWLRDYFKSARPLNFPKPALYLQCMDTV